MRHGRLMFFVQMKGEAQCKRSIIKFNLAS
jgi:hypothetical protein